VGARPQHPIASAAEEPRRALPEIPPTLKRCEELSRQGEASGNADNLVIAEMTARRASEICFVKLAEWYERVRAANKATETKKPAEKR
jgi:hypothetical protein